MRLKDIYNIPLDLLVVSIWAILTIIFIITPNVQNVQNNIIRAILGIPFVLFIPGYVLVSTLFPRKDDLDRIERITLSLGLSMAIVPLLGLLLNFTFGIRLYQILITLGIYIFILVILSVYRRNKIALDQRFVISFDKISRTIKNDIKTESSADKTLTVILIFSIIIAMYILAIVIPKNGERLTEFYILDKDGKSVNYSVKLANNTEENIIIGVVNHEYVPINYTIRTLLDKDILNNISLNISHNQTWEKNVSFIPNKVGDNLRLEFELYKENNFTTPYRDLHLWIDVTK